ncbi:MAG: PilZ domain-containing protein [Myxococcaceae bacterium]|nr:PilZ domain-containing protein [Myxococcaceae bacterium]
MGFSPIRQFQRYAVQLLAIAVSASPRLDHVHNLSKSGARISSRAAPEAGSPYTFLLIIPGTATRAQVLKLPAKVVWTATGEFGVRFDAQDAGLDRFVDQLAEQVEPANVTRA